MVEVTMHTVKRLVLIALALSLTAGLGCSHIGPGTIARDRFDYIGALSDSAKQQMLYNMVKIRYGEVPVFLEIASVINQYAIETDINVAATWQAPQGLNSNILAVGAVGRYLDRPTITYSPLIGEKFARQFMRPIPPSAVMGLIEGGYPVDSVLRFCVNSINGIRNSFSGPAQQRLADPDFYPLIERMRKVQEDGAISLRLQKTGEMEGTAMVFRKKVDKVDLEDILFIRKTLGLDPEGQEFKIVYGAISKDDKELAILTRSIMQIVINLSSSIEVPAAHVEEKRTNPTPPGETFQGAPVAALIKIHSSPDKPCDAVVSVQYRGYWFWIDDHDLRSKTFFAFLMLLFSLTETGGKENAPIITIPVG
jgi:hypothetical protein